MSALVPVPRTALLAAVLVSTLASPAHAVNDVAALQTAALAATCANCHGTAGQAVERSTVPPLAGIQRDNFIAQMKDFRGPNTRKATVMHQLAKGYTDAQIEQLATYFAAQKR